LTHVRIIVAWERGYLLACMFSSHDHSMSWSHKPSTVSTTGTETTHTYHRLTLGTVTAWMAIAYTVCILMCQGTCSQNGILLLPCKPLLWSGQETRFHLNTS